MCAQRCAETVHQAVGDAGVRSFVSHHVQKPATEPMGALFVALLACRSAPASSMNAICLACVSQSCTEQRLKRGVRIDGDEACRSADVAQAASDEGFQTTEATAQTVLDVQVWYEDCHVTLRSETRSFADAEQVD